MQRGQVYQHNCFSTKSNSNKIRESLRSKKTCVSSYKFDECMNPGGYSHTLPIRVCAAQRGRDFEAPDLERGIHFRGVL